VQHSWQRRIERAKDLAQADARAATLLNQYADILTVQRTCYETLLTRPEQLTGSLGRDLAHVRGAAAAAFTAIAACAPANVSAEAPRDAGAIDALLRDGWREASIPFLARLVLQPYAEALAELARADHLRQGDGGPPKRSAKAEAPAYDRRPADRNLQPSPGREACPFCGGPPQVSVLRHDSGADGGSRALICATCSTAWQVRRILCAACGEDDERRLQYFRAPEFDHLRVDACETCRHYLKSVDLTRLGLAVPVVDEIASAVLDLWASEHRYTKVTPNLIGL